MDDLKKKGYQDRCKKSSQPWEKSYNKKKRKKTSRSEDSDMSFGGITIPKVDI
jgi:sortase (surface protein transpeptidase)